MNITMKMTLDGLVRALRWRGHDLADETEQGYRRDMRPPADEAPPRAFDSRRGNIEGAPR